MTLIPPQYKLAAYGIAMAILVAGVSAWHIHGTRLAREEGRQEVQAKWDKERAQQAQDLLQHNAAVREEERRRTIAQEQIDHDNQARIRKAQSDASSAAAALERLRNVLKTTGSTPAKRLPGDPVPTFVCTADPEVRELLRSCASRYVSMAGEADKAYSAGLACEKWADSLKPSTRPTSSQPLAQP